MPVYIDDDLRGPSSPTLTLLFYIHVGVRLQTHSSVVAKLHPYLNGEKYINLLDFSLLCFFETRMLPLLKDFGPIDELQRNTYLAVLCQLPPGIDRPRYLRDLYSVLLREGIISWPASIPHLTEEDLHRLAFDEEVKAESDELSDSEDWDMLQEEFPRVGPVEDTEEDGSETHEFAQDETLVFSSKALETLEQSSGDNHRDGRGESPPVSLWSLWPFSRASGMPNATRSQMAQEMAQSRRARDLEHAQLGEYIDRDRLRRQQQHMADYPQLAQPRAIDCHCPLNHASLPSIADWVGSSFHAHHSHQERETAHYNQKDPTREWHDVEWAINKGVENMSLGELPTAPVNSPHSARSASPAESFVTASSRNYPCRCQC